VDSWDRILPRVSWPFANIGTDTRTSPNTAGLQVAARFHARLHALGYSPMTFPVASANQAIGFIIADDLFALRIELQQSPNPSCDVAQVAQRRREMADLDVGVGAFAALDAVEEVPVMRA
jgi:hypothetical protein